MTVDGYDDIPEDDTSEADGGGNAADHTSSWDNTMQNIAQQSMTMLAQAGTRAMANAIAGAGQRDSGAYGTQGRVIVGRAGDGTPLAAVGSTGGTAIFASAKLMAGIILVLAITLYVAK